MKLIFLLLFLCPVLAWAQADTLKPIGSELIPTYNGQYGSGVAIQYMYDGLDVRRPKELGKYIMASGSPEAIQAFQQYKSSRRAGGWLIAAGALSMVIGTPIMLSNKPDADGKFLMRQAYKCPAGYVCSSGMGGIGGPLPTVQVPDVARLRANNVGSAMFLAGGLVAGIGSLMIFPGRNFRTAVQHYNRALKQRGISWQVSPYSTFSNSGVGFVGTF